MKQARELGTMLMKINMLSLQLPNIPVQCICLTGDIFLCTEYHLLRTSAQTPSSKALEKVATLWQRAGSSPTACNILGIHRSSKVVPIQCEARKATVFWKISARLCNWPAPNACTAPLSYLFCNEISKSDTFPIARLLHYSCHNRSEQQELAVYQMRRFGCHRCLQLALRSKPICYSPLWCMWLLSQTLTVTKAMSLYAVKQDVSSLSVVFMSTSKILSVCCRWGRRKFDIPEMPRCPKHSSCLHRGRETISDLETRTYIHVTDLGCCLWAQCSQRLFKCNLRQNAHGLDGMLVPWQYLLNPLTTWLRSGAMTVLVMLRDALGYRSKEWSNLCAVKIPG